MVNPAAYDSVLRARYLSVRTTDADTQAAIALLERAVALDPGFARAYADLAAAVRHAADLRHARRDRGSGAEGIRGG